MDLRGVNEFLKDTFKYILVIVMVIVLFLYVISIQQVVGPSMQPTLQEGNVIVISKLNYKLGNVKRGDIIVFEYNGVKNLVKRVIGLPGEKIEFIDNTLYIDGKAYEEPYLKNIKTEDYKSGTIKENHYLVLGDNRENSMDSREIGEINKDDIIGKVVLRLWPFKKM